MDLEHNTETMKKLQARLHRALAEDMLVVSNQKTGKMIKTEAMYPKNISDHFFDCEDGLRLIISFDSIDGNDPRLHVTSTSSPKCEFHIACVAVLTDRGPDAAARKILTDIMDRIKELFGKDIPLEPLGIDEGVVHFVGPTRREYAALTATECN